MTQDTEGEVAQHEQATIDAFAAVLTIEDSMAAIKVEMNRLNSELELNERGLRAAWQTVADLMAATGEVEMLLPGTGVDYKVGWTTPRESVKVEPEAVPDEFCKLERKPKLREIGEWLREQRDAGVDLPNWGRFELGERRLSWKAVKKTTK